MHRSALLIVLAGALIASAGCRSAVPQERHQEVREGALLQRSLREYRLVYSEYDGKVGYMKEYDVQDAGQATYRWKFVYDLDWKEVGFLDQYGNAYKYHYYGDFQQSLHKVSFRQDRLPRDSIPQNVMRMLDIDPSGDNVSFPTATHEDIVGAPAGPAQGGPSADSDEE